MDEGIYVAAAARFLGPAAVWQWAPKVKRNSTLAPDPVLCSDGWPERLAFARFRDEFVLSSLGYGFMRVEEEIGTRLGEIPHGRFCQEDGWDRGEAPGESWEDL